jgi:hypothetical protein
VDGGRGVVLSLQVEGCQHQGFNKPSIAFRACRQLANDKRKCAKGIRRMHCTVVQCSGGNLRPPSLLLMLVEEGRRRDFTGGHGEYLFLWGM